jgi:hypothetical protein
MEDMTRKTPKGETAYMGTLTIFVSWPLLGATLEVAQ